MTTSGKDYYRILQVDPAAEPEVIEAAYRRLALKYHPDVNRSPDAKQRMQEINEAYEMLRVPLKRASYDRERDPSKNREAREQSSGRTERVYGGIKASYEVIKREDGRIELRVLHSNRSTRSVLLDHSSNPSRLLRHYDTYARSTIKAQFYLSEVMTDY